MPDGGFELVFQLEVARSREDVFAFLTSPEGLRAVDPALVDYGPPGPLGANGKGWFKHRRGGVTANTTWTSRPSSPRRASRLPSPAWATR